MRTTITMCLAVLKLEVHNRYIGGTVSFGGNHSLFLYPEIASATHPPHSLFILFDIPRLLTWDIRHMSDVMETRKTTKGLCLRSCHLMTF
jgi:hypothetical protein